ncbi:sialate O-acetylesterase [Coraliomargarita algicola]|uniref:Sialate O-acetylesterase n=1 Tax=Coraliomargarita algicola TaxID=3092156 RepID=A0ABZ0RJP1_9BACT|nr:sialate O-acetylesterase [Coraliomargarita sp. J2-16]WPJ96431.1 sialate O-acetylesterase [Coraliomargarita sp. J2-16]
MQKISRFTLLLLLSITLVHAKEIDVYLAAGQSNAKAIWAQSIQSELRRLSNNQDLQVVHSHHPGNWLNAWWKDDQPQKNYTDNYNAVQAKFKQILAAGNTPIFKGIFWFQGEGDTRSPRDKALYKARFKAYIHRLESDFQSSEITPVITVIDGNSAPKYDDPKNLAGRTRQDVEGMRKILFELSEEVNGLAVDSRDYKRGDAWHIESSDLIALGQESAQLYYEKFLAPNNTSTDSNQCCN